MNYWKGLMLAAAIDLVWIMGCPFLATAPEPPTLSREEPGAAYVDKSPDVEQLAEVSLLEDSLMAYLQEHSDDVDAIEKIADVYADNGWWDAAIDPLARALQLDPSRRSLWSALDRAVERSGKVKITDAELTRHAAAFVEAVEMRGHGLLIDQPTSIGRRTSRYTRAD
jgi:cytochrome c-type biogenesis protein CcmH/NrfG